MKKVEWIEGIDLVGAKFSSRNQTIELSDQQIRPTELATGRGHDLNRNVILDCRRQNSISSGLIKKVEVQHDYVPIVILYSVLQHHMIDVTTGIFRDANEPNFSLIAKFHNRRYQYIHGVFIT